MSLLQKVKKNPDEMVQNAAFYQSALFAITSNSILRERNSVFCVEIVTCDLSIFSKEHADNWIKLYGKIHWVQEYASFTSSVLLQNNTISYKLALYSLQDKWKKINAPAN